MHFSCARSNLVRTTQHKHTPHVWHAITHTIQKRSARIRTNAMRTWLEVTRTIDEQPLVQVYWMYCFFPHTHQTQRGYTTRQPAARSAKLTCLGPITVVKRVDAPTSILATATSVSYQKTFLPLSYTPRIVRFVTSNYSETPDMDADVVPKGSTNRRAEFCH